MLRRRLVRTAAAVLLCGVCGCSSLFFGAMEKMGVPKREIMLQRVKAARTSQQEARQQFVSALEQFKSVVQFKGGNLEAEYNRLNTALQRSEAKAEEVRRRIRSVEEVSDALFREWRAELKQYSNAALRRSSEQQYDATKKKYAELIKAMKQAESRMDPALAPLRDQVLFLKHNLNARAIAGLDAELAGVQANVDVLLGEIEKSIRQADAFIAALQSGSGG